MDIIKELYAVILDRKAHPEEGSYTNYLLDKGTEKIAKKVGEEAVETAIASAKRDKAETVGEIADLIAGQGFTVYSDRPSSHLTGKLIALRTADIKEDDR